MVTLIEAELLHSIASIKGTGPFRGLVPKQPVTLHYGNNTAEISASKEANFSGILFTSVGSTIARLYTPEERPLGQKLLDEIVEECKKQKWQVRTFTQ